MIACAYNMHLYCDCRECSNGVSSRRAFAEYDGESWKDTAGKARKAGWTISRDKLRAYAPGHNRKPPELSAGERKAAW